MTRPKFTPELIAVVAIIVLATIPNTDWGTRVTARLAELGTLGDLIGAAWGLTLPVLLIFITYRLANRVRRR